MESFKIICEVEQININREERRRDELNFSLQGTPLKAINTEITFKYDECVICLTNPPSVLFCNCGHIPLCVECDKTKSVKDCPICKTGNTIKRMLN